MLNLLQIAPIHPKEHCRPLQMVTTLLLLPSNAPPKKKSLPPLKKKPMSPTISSCDWCVCLLLRRLILIELFFIAMHVYILPMHIIIKSTALRDYTLGDHNHFTLRRHSARSLHFLKQHSICMSKKPCLNSQAARKFSHAFLYSLLKALKNHTSKHCVIVVLL